MHITHLFNITVSTKRLTNTVDVGGFPTTSYATNLSALKCRIQQATGSQSVSGGRPFSKYAYILYCASSEDILLKDRIVYDSTEYEIVEMTKEGNNLVYAKLGLEKVDA